MTHGQNAGAVNVTLHPVSHEVEIEVTHGVGLHARPSVTFTRLAKSFACVIEFEVNRNNVWLNGKSIVNVMGAKIRKGSLLRMRARGVGAKEALNALKALVERNFDEGKKHV